MSKKKEKEERILPGINFIRNIIDKDIQNNISLRSQLNKKKDIKIKPNDDLVKSSLKIRTRFPPEPNGYLHLGHAKSICLNFGIAKDYNGRCHLRFDDTNPISEDEEYVNSIMESVRWLGFSWHGSAYYASDYFEKLYNFAIKFIENNDAYVDSSSADDIRFRRGTLKESGIDSPFRERSVKENLELFREMREGKFLNGEHVLRLKIDMEAPNINLRDPIIYRIRHERHHKTENRWCIYPMYDYTHCISDALEKISHSLCTLEFEDHRPLYDWILKKLVEYKVLVSPVPHQYEFSRLNLSHVVLSKRKLITLVEKKVVDGWNDPRMPTLVGVKRRGYPPEALRLFCEKIGISKADSIIDYTVLEDCVREVLNRKCDRRFMIRSPLRLVIDNFPSDQEDICIAHNHPQDSSRGTREMHFTKELWIDNNDFMIDAPENYFRLTLGSKVRLKFGYIVECIGLETNKAGFPETIYCTYFPDTKSGSPGSNTIKVKGNIHWLSQKHSVACTLNVLDRLFLLPNPSSNENFLDQINPKSKQTINGLVEPSLRFAKFGESFQFERHGYFTRDISENQSLIFNRTVTLRDTWLKSNK